MENDNSSHSTHHHGHQHHDLAEHKQEQSLQRCDSLTQFHCNICYNLMVEPCQLKPFCSHKYCIQCCNQFLQQKRACPLCRTDISYQFQPKIDKTFQAQIKELKPEEFSRRFQELESSGKLVGDQFEVEFEIGHRYQYREDTRATDGRQAQHRCIPFVRIRDPALRPLINSLVQEVEFKLCQCDNINCENTIKKKPKCNNCENCLKKNGGWVEPDYEVSAVLNCWEQFSVPIKLYFKSELDPNPTKEEVEKCKCCNKKSIDLERLPAFRTVHELKWEGHGVWQTYKVQFNKKRFQQLVRREGLQWVFQPSDGERVKRPQREYPSRLAGVRPLKAAGAAIAQQNVINRHHEVSGSNRK